MSYDFNLPCDNIFSWQVSFIFFSYRVFLLLLLGGCASKCSNVLSFSRLAISKGFMWSEGRTQGSFPDCCAQIFSLPILQCWKNTVLLCSFASFGSPKSGITASFELPQLLLTRSSSLCFPCYIFLFKKAVFSISQVCC